MDDTGYSIELLLLNPPLSTELGGEWSSFSEGGWQLVEWKCSFLLLNPPLSTELGGEWSSFMKVWVAPDSVEELSCSVDDMY